MTVKLDNTLHPKSYPWRQALGLPALVLSCLFINALSLTLPIVTLQVYDRILPNPQSGTLVVLIFGACAAIVLETVLRLSRSYIIGLSATSYEHILSQKLMSCLLASKSNKERFDVSRSMQNFMDISKIKDFHSGYSLMIIIDLLFIPIFIYLIYLVAGSLIWVPISCIATFLILSLLNGHHLKSRLKQREETDHQRYRFIIDALKGIHTIKSFALEKIFSRRYEEKVSDSTIAHYNVAALGAAMHNTTAIFSNIIVVLVIGFGASSVIKGDLTTGGLIAVLLLSGRLMQPIQRGLSLWMNYQDFSIARDNISAILDNYEEPSITKNDERNNNSGLVLNGLKLSAENSAFNLKLPKHGVYGVQSKNFEHIRQFINMLSGDLPPFSGEVLFNGIDLNKTHLVHMKSVVGVIASKSTIFRGTIRENITNYGFNNDALAKQLSGIIGLDKSIARLPSGLDTYLTGTHVDSIPLSMKRKIDIIRVLSSKPRFLVINDLNLPLGKDLVPGIKRIMDELSKTCLVIIASKNPLLLHDVEKLINIDRSELISNPTMSTKSVGR